MKESAFDSLVSETQDLEFSYLEKKLQETIGIGSLTDDVLRTLGLCTKEGHYSNAAALMADQNSFFGVDIARFGDSIDYILDRKTLSNISVLSQYDQSVEMYRQYYGTVNK
jgi:ATP-dependent DNA helicase RecG